MPPAVSTAARRAKRVIESESPPESDAVEEVDLDEELESEDPLAGSVDDDEEDEDEDEEEEDGDGDADADGDFSIAPTPEPVKIKLRVNPASAAPGRTKRAAAIAAGNKRKRKETDELEEEEVEEEEEIVVEEEEVEEGSVSPSKMTARQRAAKNKDLQETLLVLPDGQTGKAKPMLTEAERLQKREEMARRRKRQNEQRLQDEQDQTINRLLRAQTGRSRAKLDNPSPLPEGESRDSGVSSPTKRVVPVPLFDGIHYESRLDDGKLVLNVSVQSGHEDWIALPPSSGPKVHNVPATCAVPGCALPRKYRTTSDFSKGGCSLPHLKEVEKSIKA